MSGGSKFSSQVPKGDAWGVERAIAAAALEFEETGRSPAIPCIAVIGIKGVNLGTGDGDGPTRIPVVQILRIESLTTPDAIREGQKLILKALGDRDKLDKGGQPMLPFEETDILNMAFGDMNAEQIERDERERIEDENIDDPERLRRHLIAVHGLTELEAHGMEWVDVTTRHSSDHDTLDAGEETGLAPHDREWWGWRRVDLEAAEAESDGTSDDAEATAEGPEDEGDAETADAADQDDDGDDDGTADVTPEFRDGGQDQEN